MVTIPGRSRGVGGIQARMKDCQMASAAFARGRRLSRSGASPWTRGVIVLLTCAAARGRRLGWRGAVRVSARCTTSTSSASTCPTSAPFTRFEFPTIGRIYDTNGQPLIELAREYRHITQYADIPPIVRDAILAAEDKRFFSHNGVDYFSIPRVIGKVRLGAWATRLATAGRRDNMPRPGDLPAGRLDDHAAARARRVSPAPDVAGKQLPAPERRPPASRAVVGDRRAERQHGAPEARRDAALVVDRTTDARAVRIEAPREGRDPRPLCELRLHGERAVRICAGGGILLRPAVSPRSPPMTPTRRRCWRASRSRPATTRPTANDTGPGPAPAATRSWRSWPRRVSFPATR